MFSDFNDIFDILFDNKVKLICVVIGCTVWNYFIFKISYRIESNFIKVFGKKNNKHFLSIAFLMCLIGLIIQFMTNIIFFMYPPIFDNMLLYLPLHYIISYIITFLILLFVKSSKIKLQFILKAKIIGAVVFLINPIWGYLLLNTYML